MSVLLRPGVAGKKNRSRGVMFGRRRKTSSFSPSSVAGLLAWYKADAITGKNDGDALASWADSSGNSRDAAQATGTKQPLYKTNQFGSLPGVKFDGVDDWLVSPNFSQAQPYTLFAVLKFTGVWAAANDDAVGGGGNLFRISGGANGSYNIYAGGGGVTATVGSTLTAHVVCGIFNGASSKINVDGGAQVTGNPSTGAMAKISLGADSAGAAPADVTLGEVLLYNSALSDVNRALLEAYLKGRWGTP